MESGYPISGVTGSGKVLSGGHVVPARPEAERLLKSPEYRRAVEILEGKQRRSSTRHQVPLEQWVVGLALRAIAAPDIAETMTASERRKFAVDVKDATTRLWDSIGPFLGPNGRNWPFQPVFDRLALEVAIDDESRWARDDLDVEEISHRTRFAIYHLLMRRLDWLFEAIDEAAEWVADTETVLKKPNDPNAKRLYFLRQVTKGLVGEFGSPCRAAALALASVYFDCSDLDEAAISKLAPVVKPVPVEMSRQEFEDMVDKLERTIETYAARPNVDPGKVQELRDTLNEVVDSKRKDQLNEGG